MTLDAGAVDACLTSKFHFDRDEGAKHIKFRREVDGIIVARTVMSRSHDDLGAPIVSAMARQLGVSSKQLREMIGCTIDEPSYLIIIR